MKKFIIPFLMLPMAVVFWACSENEVENPEVKVDEWETVESVEPMQTDKNIQFTSEEKSALVRLETMAFDLYGTAAISENVLLESSNGNFNLSPASAAICFTMFANSLDEPYRTKVVRALGFKSLEQMNTLTAKLLAYLPAEGLGVNIALANAVWYKDKFTLDPAYKALMNETFHSPASPIDFTDEQTALDIINQWCSDHTNGLIKHVLSELSPKTCAVWANALYFLGKWHNEFDEKDTDKAKFNGLKGISTVDMMHREFTTKYAKTEAGEMVSLQFAGGAYALDLILTDGEPLTRAAYKALTNKLKNWIVDLSLPRFNVECKANLLEIYPNIKSATENATMATMGFPAYYQFGDVQSVQKACITVNEKGAEAAAVTIIAMGEMATLEPEEPGHVKVVFDRPFSYVLRNRTNGIILFVGQVNNL